MEEWDTCAQFWLKKQNKNTVDKVSPNYGPQAKSGP